MRIGILKLMAGCIAFGVHSAIATTYTCTSVEKKAMVGAPSDVTVSVTSGKQTCSFGVAGASVDANRQKQFASAMNELLQGSFSHNEAIRTLLTLLMAAPGNQSPSQNLEMSFGNRIRSKIRDIEGCVRGFREGTDRSFDDKFSGVSCQFVDPRRNTSLGGQVEIQTDTPVLALGATIGEERHFLFVPQLLFRRALMR